MNIKIRNVLVICCCIVPIVCSGQNLNVVKVDSKEAPSAAEGVFYSLPRTQFEVEITVIKTENVKGPYSEFASRYLGLTNVITENSFSYELGEISIKTFAIPDPEQFYFVELTDSKGRFSRDLLISLSESGIIQNTSGADQHEREIVNFTVPPEESNVYPDIFKYYSDLNLFEKIDTIIETIKEDTSTVEKIVLRKTMVEKSPEQKAKETADFIIKIKENRFNLMSGYQEVSYDKETFAMMNQEIEKLESEYQKLFTGLTFTKTLTYRFWYTPEAPRVSDSVPLFRISRLRGIQEVGSQYGETVFLTIRKNNNTYLLSDYIRRKPAPKNGVHGFYYRIPEHADLTICVGNKALIKGKFLVSQYGVIHWLPAARTHMQFHPASGSLKQLEIRK